MTREEVGSLRPGDMIEWRRTTRDGEIHVYAVAAEGLTCKYSQPVMEFINLYDLSSGAFGDRDNYYEVGHRFALVYDDIARECASITEIPSD